MINPIYSATIILVLFFMQVAHGLPKEPSLVVVTPSAPPATATPTQPPVISSSSNPPPPKETNPIGAPSPLRATYDPVFDNRGGSTNTVACSNGPNGLASRFPTFGSFPSFPFIGGAYDVVWSSPNCGACWNITNPKSGASIHLLAIDTSGSGFNIAQQAFENLNGGNIGDGVIEVTANKVAPSVCGL